MFEALLRIADLVWLDGGFVAQGRDFLGVRMTRAAIPRRLRDKGGDSKNGRPRRTGGPRGVA